MSTRRKLAGAAALAGLLAVTAAVPAIAGHGQGDRPRHRQKPVRFEALGASLSGANEVPGPGDADGVGVADIQIAARGGALCFSIAVEGIGLPGTAAHIHAGATGVAGDPVVTLEAPTAFGSGTTGIASGCLTKLDGSMLRDIARNPDQYYVNVHNAEFPGGALRGQLSAA